jgi:hypothetical protein
MIKPMVKKIGSKERKIQLMVIMIISMVPTIKLREVTIELKEIMIKSMDLTM